MQGLTKKQPKPLINLLGLSLIERVILSFKKVNVRDFIIVVGYMGEKIKAKLGDGGRYDVKIKYVENDEWQKGNGLSVLKARVFLKENFVLTMADHVFEHTVLEKLMATQLKTDENLLVVDRKPAEYIDLKEATKVRIKDQKVVDIGKNIRNYDGVDCGLFMLTPSIFNALEESIEKGDDSLTGGIKNLAENKKMIFLETEKNSFWVDIDDEHILKKAEKELLSRLKKPSDGLISRYLNRFFSTRVSKHLVETDVTPNQMSLITFLISCIGSVFFFQRGHINLFLGGLIVQISSVLDGCDGEIARLKFQESKIGAWIDSVLDRYADAFMIIGLNYYVFAIKTNILFYIIGFLSLTGTLINSYTADKYDSLMKKKFSTKKNKYFLRVGRDIRVFIIFTGATLNFLLHVYINPFAIPLMILLMIAAVTNVENIRRIIVVYRDEKKEFF